MTATDRFVASLGLILVSAIVGGHVAFYETCLDPCTGDVCVGLTVCERVPYRNIVGAALFIGAVIAAIIWSRVARKASRYEAGQDP